MPRKKADPDQVDTRGQITVPLEGQEYVLRPSYEAVVSIERQLGRGTYELAGEATQGRLSLSDMGVIVAEMMKAFGKANPDDPMASTYRGATAARIGELIYESGGPKIAARITVVLMGVLVGGYTASGEAKAPEMTKT